MFGIGTWEMVVIFVIALLVFGPEKLPELAKKLGKGLGELRKATQEFKNTLDLEMNRDYTHKIDHEVQKPVEQPPLPIPPATSGKPEAERRTTEPASPSPEAPPDESV